MEESFQKIYRLILVLILFISFLFFHGYRLVIVSDYEQGSSTIHTLKGSYNKYASAFFFLDFLVAFLSILPPLKSFLLFAFGAFLTGFDIYLVMAKRLLMGNVYGADLKKYKNDLWIRLFGATFAIVATSIIITFV